jgi:hypothetical protein
VSLLLAAVQLLLDLEEGRLQLRTLPVILLRLVGFESAW